MAVAADCGYGSFSGCEPASAEVRELIEPTIVSTGRRPINPFGL
jgi:hypothetical protein